MSQPAPSGYPTRWSTPTPPAEASWWRAWLQVVISASALACVTVVGTVAMAGLVGADARWLAALGGIIARRGTIPVGVPFAAATSVHWHNAVVLAELAFHLLESTLGDRGLMFAQLLAVAVAMVVLMRDARAGGASAEGAGFAVLVAAAGAFSSLVIARAQLSSLAIFPMLVALLRGEARAPSRRIWLVVPLIALWSNLHGGALAGVAVTLVYLACDRLRQQRWVAIGVGTGALAALCATPAGVTTVSYYRGVLANQAAARGNGLWAPLALDKPLDLLLVIAAVMLALKLRQSRLARWEMLAAIMLAAVTVHASRSGVWLVFFLAVPAALGFRSLRLWAWIMPPLATLALLGLVYAIVRGPLPSGASPALVRRAVALAGGTPILAEDIIEEQVALARGRVWIGNPIDAFSAHDQSVYLDWLGGRTAGRRAIRADVRVVVTSRASPAERLMSHDPAFAKVASDQSSMLYTRVPVAGG